MKIEETSTASLSRPPPLSRRSSTTPFAPCLISRRTAAPTSPWAPEVKLARRTWATSVPSARSIADSTTGMSTRSRSTRLVIRRSPVSQVSSTEVPGRPRIFALPSFVEAPCSDVPPAATITSPARRPARSAGEPSNTRRTTSPRWRSSGSIVTPMPSNFPAVDSLKSA